MTSALRTKAAETYQPRARALGLGAVAGLRSAMAPALLSRAASRGELEGVEGTVFAPLASAKVSRVLALLAVGEAIADKTPVVPSRTSAPVLLARAGSGALCGAALFAAARRPGATGAALGAVAALTGAFAGEGFRQQAARRLGAPDLVLALVEDAVALGGGLLALRRGAPR